LGVSPKEQAARVNLIATRCRLQWMCWVTLYGVYGNLRATVIIASLMIRLSAGIGKQILDGGVLGDPPLAHNASNLSSSAHSTSTSPSRRSMSSLMCVRISLRHPSCALWAISVR
jgi:hypothetical protein